MKKSLFIFMLLMTFVFTGCKITSSPEETPNTPTQIPTYTVIWKNYDGTVLETDTNVEEGVTPTYDGQTPTKPRTNQYSYTFEGWGPEVKPVNQDVTYAAIFTTVVNKYTVTWLNHDETVLETDTEVEYGTIPSYEGETPVKPSTESKTYNFVGWDKELIAITGDITYIALFDSSDVTYTVTWKNHDGTVLEIDDAVKYGTNPEYNGQTPLKEITDQYTYVFKGWDIEVSPVTKNVVYTATFNETVNTYTVTWLNYDGTVLEVDSNVEYGTTPTYNGSVPVKPGNEIYYFKGWDKDITEVTEDVTYTAVFEELNEGTIDGVLPQISQDGKTIIYGLYPKTHIKDTSIISELEKLQPSPTNGWYLYNNEYYALETANVYNGESYYFDDGTKIVNGTTYWFKCEPIEWNVLKNNDGSYSLVSKYLIDTHSYYEQYSNRTDNNQTIYANNYEQSDIRKWLNKDFFETAFKLTGAFISEVSNDNSASTTDKEENKYACNNTTDKVYLLSYQDYLNVDYGFDGNNGLSESREAKTTDYARAKGAWYNTESSLEFNGTYWTRSATSEYYYCAWNVNSGGYLSTYAVDGQNHCVRPSITLNYTFY